MIHDIRDVVNDRRPTGGDGSYQPGQCVAVDSDGICTNYVVEYESNFVSELGGFPSGVPVLESTEENSEVSGISVRRMPCDYSRLTAADWEVLGLERRNDGWANSAGFLIGLSGFGTSTDVDDSPGHVLDIAGICAPWSFNPWTDNWDFVYSRSNTVSPEVGVKIGYIGRHINNISEFITSGLEIRMLNLWDDPDKKKEAVRPVSLKTCPPNMLLTGLEVTVDATQNQSHLVSIDALLCDVPNLILESVVEEGPEYYADIMEQLESGRHDSNSPEGNIDVPLGVWVDGNSPANKMSPFRRELRSGLNYNYGESIFSLSQLIGPSDSAFGPPYAKGEVKCDSGQYAIGIGVARDSSSRIQTIELMCSSL
jgi:hypothetical protein